MKIKIDCTEQLGLKKMQILKQALSSECTEIVCINLFSSFPLADHPSIMKLLESKMRIGGVLIFEDFDLRTISRRFYRDEISVSFANSAIFGEHANLKSIVDMDSIEENLNINYTVLEKSYLGDQGRFTLKARREQ